jgi:hypothetical protein
VHHGGSLNFKREHAISILESREGITERAKQGLAENRMAELLPIVRPNTGPTGSKHRGPIPSAAPVIMYEPGESHTNIGCNNVAHYTIHIIKIS